MKERRGCIYKISNDIDNKVYIGQTVDFERRKNEHRYRHNKNYSQSQLYNAMNKYGIDSFNIEILEEAPLNELNHLEMKYIEKYQAFDKGYNLTKGGDRSPSNMKLTEADVVFIRKLYHSRTKLTNKEIWLKHFKGVISFGHFRNVWRGEYWEHIMPEVYTEESKDFYKRRGSGSDRRRFTEEEVIEIRTVRPLYAMIDLFNKYGKGRISFSGFEKLVRGPNYADIPSVKELQEAQ